MDEDRFALYNVRRRVECMCIHCNLLPACQKHPPSRTLVPLPFLEAFTSREIGEGIHSGLEHCNIGSIVHSTGHYRGISTKALGDEPA